MPETKEQRTHRLAMSIVKLFIDNEIPIDQQLKIIDNVREKIQFCRSTGQSMKQFKMEI